MVLRKGSIGDSVKEIQKILGLKVDGHFGGITEAAVKKFQSENGLKVDGIVGSKTYAKIITFSTGSYDFIDNNVTGPNLGDYTTVDGLKIYKRYLDSDQFVTDQGKTKKETVFIHHTAGRGNPFKTIENWNLDNRGRIATQYCIGRTSIEGDESNNGVVVESFPDEFFAWHLGSVGSKRMHSHSIGIELNNWGWLTEKNGKFYNYVNIEIPIDQVTDLGEKFLGYRYYHSYTKEQMISLNLLLKEIVRRHPNVNLNNGLTEWIKNESPNTAFGFKQDAYNGRIKGLLTHTNVRKDKTDCPPQPLLVEMLKNL